VLSESSPPSKLFEIAYKLLDYRLPLLDFNCRILNIFKHILKRFAFNNWIFCFHIPCSPNAITSFHAKHFPRVWDMVLVDSKIFTSGPGVPLQVHKGDITSPGCSGLGRQLVLLFFPSPRLQFPSALFDAAPQETHLIEF